MCNRSVIINVLFTFLIPQMVILLQFYINHMNASVHLTACMYITACKIKGGDSFKKIRGAHSGKIICSLYNYVHPACKVGGLDPHISALENDF